MNNEWIECVQCGQFRRVEQSALTCPRCASYAYLASPAADAASVEAHTFAEFIDKVKALLEPTAAGKGYNTTGIDGQNDLYEFVQSFASDHHALGEIVYKAKRYAAKGNPEDILKIAAWAFLVWKHR